VLAEKAKRLEEAREMLQENIKNGKAIESLKKLFQSQGGNAAVVDDISLLPTARHKIEVYAKEAGYVSEIIADKIGCAAIYGGAGRVAKACVIVLAMGIELDKKIGEQVEIGDRLVTVHSNTESIDKTKASIDEAYKITDKSVELPVLIHTEVE